MSLVSSLRAFHLGWLSRPAAERPIYRAIRRRRAQRIVEIGIGGLQRAERMIAAARLASPAANVQYAGIDEFELRRDGRAPLPLKSAWQSLRETGARIRLIPGGAASALVRCANDLIGTDLLLVSASVSRDAMRQAHSYLPRMLGNDSLILLEEPCADGKGFRLRRVTLSEWASTPPGQRRLAA